MLELPPFYYICATKKNQVIAYDREITACFTGHRSYDGSRNEELECAIRELYALGYRNFLCGMAVGFDLEAAEVALALRDELAGLRVVAVIAFEGMESRFSALQRALFDQISVKADDKIVLATSYSPSVYANRNNYLVDNSSACIAYFDGSKGGTAYTVRRAAKGLLRLVNIYNNPQRKLF